MFKKTLSVLLAVLMVVSVLTVGVVTAGAVTTDGFTPDPNKLYFDVDGTGWTMGAKDKIAFYMVGGDFDTETNATKPVDWGGSKLIGTATAGESGIFEIDPVEKLGYQFTDGVQYKIIFVHIKAPRTWAEQTCSVFFTTDCFGHVAYSDGSMMENDVDSTKKSYAAYWKDMDATQYGPALCITSIGNVVGSCVEQGKTKYSLFVEFLSEPKTDFQNKTCYQNAHKYKCEISPEADGYKTEQKLIDDIGAGLGLTKDEVQQAFDEQVVKDYLETSGLGCDWSYDASTLPGGAAHEHTAGDPVEENVTPATCTAEGSYDEVVYCTECGEEISRETKTIEKLAHTPGEAVRENEVPATCTAEGSYDEVIYCTECKTEISRETKTIEKLAHTPGEAVKENEVEADCENAGGYDEIVRCTVCNEVISTTHVDVPALGHEIVFVEEVPATASKDGVKAHYECTRCGKLYADATGTTEVKAEDLVIKAEHVRGDADGNALFETIDITVIQRVLAEYEVPSYDAIAADADLDGEVDIIDVSLLQRVDVGITTFEQWDAKHAK